MLTGASTVAKRMGLAHNACPPVGRPKTTPGLVSVNALTRGFVLRAKPEAKSPAKLEATVDTNLWAGPGSSGSPSSRLSLAASPARSSGAASGFWEPDLASSGLAGNTPAVVRAAELGCAGAFSA